MDEFDRERIDADLLEVEERLRIHAPSATPLELDRIKLRVMSAMAAPRRSRQRKGGFMRSRIAVTVMLVLGLLLSTTGAGLAVSGISGDGSASRFEYPDEQSQAVQGETAAGAQGAPEQGVQGAAQAAEQVQVTGGDDGLAFTGFAAIPLLLAGVGLVGAGIVLRRNRQGT